MVEFRILEALLYVLPAYCANGAPVLFTKRFPKLHPLDRGLMLRDGRRALGNGKTLEGLISGISSGLIVGGAIYSVVPGFYSSFLEPLFLTSGAMLGDIVGSFLKRRLGLKRGHPAPVLDQLGFLLVALALLVSTYGIPSWLNVETFLALLGLTALLHVSTNYGAYKLRLKDKPW